MVRYTVQVSYSLTYFIGHVADADADPDPIFHCDAGS
jgi:hypothetical protein